MSLDVNTAFRYAKGMGNDDPIDYDGEPFSDFHAGWQAATEAANKQAAEPIGWIIGDFPTRCRASFEMNGMVMHSHRCGAATTPVYTAAKATGTAGELPPEWISEVCGPDVDDLSYGQGYRRGFNDCRKKVAELQAEAARQPAPVVVKDLTDKEIDALAEPLINYESGDRISYYKVRAIVRAALAAATNRSQP